MSLVHKKHEADLDEHLILSARDLSEPLGVAMRFNLAPDAGSKRLSWSWQPWKAAADFSRLASFGFSMFNLRRQLGAPRNTKSDLQSSDKKREATTEKLALVARSQ